MIDPADPQDDHHESALASAVGDPTFHCSPAPLAGDAIHVWRVELASGPSDAAALADEQQRAKQMLDGPLRTHFLASHIWLRVILGRYLGVEAEAVSFSVAERGKPSIIDGGDLRFSLSRSAGVALIAVTRARAVGVDIERIRADLEHETLAKRFFASVETDTLAKLPETDRRDAFFHLWVRKEAVVKASGAGIGDGLSHLDVRGDRVAGRWSVASLDAGTGYAAAVALDGAMGSVDHYAPGSWIR